MAECGSISQPSWRQFQVKDCFHQLLHKHTVIPKMMVRIIDWSHKYVNENYMLDMFSLVECLNTIYSQNCLSDRLNSATFCLKRPYLVPPNVNAYIIHSNSATVCLTRPATIILAPETLDVAIFSDPILNGKLMLTRKIVYVYYESQQIRK